MKRLIILVLITLICVLMTGCYGIIMETDIKADGSGSFVGKSGINETAYKLMKSYDQQMQSDDVDSNEEWTPFVYNGKTYYGTEANENFNNVQDFNDRMQIISEQSEVDIGLFELVRNEDGSLKLILRVTNETANTSDMENNINSLDISEEQKKLLIKDMVMLFSFNMPGAVTQVEGDSAGITINNNTLKIDFLKLNVPVGEGITKTYVFETKNETQSETSINSTRFTDVPVTLWSCKAINVLAEGGLVSGVGEGRFSPERGMKISEFCQVLANATGLESGADESGYWAAKAIQSCIDKGYIYTHGEINSQNYDEVITREEAIAAMQLASGRPQIIDKNVSIQDIPDGSEISDKYKSLVLQAYNSGITTGVNEQLKFSPKNQLTRGEVCQLFYNVNWITPIER